MLHLVFVQMYVQCKNTCTNTTSSVSRTDSYDNTSTLLGWDPRLLWTGYTFDDEGIPMKYDQFLGGRMELAGFAEYHFKRAE